MREPTVYLDPGARVWLTRPYHRIVIPCVVEECVDVYVGTGDETIWHYRRLDSSENSVTTQSAGSWLESKDESILAGPRRVNQFLWVDEPVGHSVTLGDECFLTLGEAIGTISPSSPRHLKRRLKATRKWRRSPDLTYPEKKVYVRRR